MNPLPAAGAEKIQIIDVLSRWVVSAMGFEEFFPLKVVFESTTNGNRSRVLARLTDSSEGADSLTKVESIVDVSRSTSRLLRARVPGGPARSCWFPTGQRQRGVAARVDVWESVGGQNSLQKEFFRRKTLHDDCAQRTLVLVEK